MIIPLTVAPEKQDKYVKNMLLLIGNTGKTILFAYDHRLEHLQYDFYGNDTVPDACRAEHAFTIASQGNINAFVTQLGLISRYAHNFQHIPYIIKLTGKLPARSFTNDAYNYELWTLEDVISFQKMTNLHIPGIALTIYLGSTFEQQMMRTAAETIHLAHYHGFATFLFMYIRNKDLEENDPMLLAGAAGVANALGADFVKLHIPDTISIEDAHKIRCAAGNTRLLYAGGEKVDSTILLDRINHQFQHQMCDGVAIGRNLFQRSVSESIKLVDQIKKIKIVRY